MDKNATPTRLYLFAAIQAELPGPDGPVDFVAGSYLVTMSDGSQVLIDTGPPADMMPGVEVVTATQQLGRLGIRPEDVAAVVSTHFDGDHIGENDAFPNAQHYVQKDHLEVARSGYERFAPARAHWDVPAERITTVDGDAELFPGFKVLSTPGHVPAHQSVLLTLPGTGPVLIAADAVPKQRLFTPDRERDGYDAGDVEELRASTRKLLQAAEETGATLVIHHHDGAQWKTLKLAPAFYD